MMAVEKKVTDKQKRYRSKPGPGSIPTEERRISATLSISNKDTNRLNRFREAVEFKEGGSVEKERLIDIAMMLGYQAIDAYCEQVEREIEAISGEV